MRAAGRRPAAEASAARGRGKRGLLVLLADRGAGILVPLALALLGADYLAPRNLVAAMIPVSAVIADARRLARAPGAPGSLLRAPLIVLGLAGDHDRRRTSARACSAATGARSPARSARARAARAITTVQLGATPLQYYLPGLRNLHPGTKVLVDEIDETGYAPLRRDAGSPPAPGLRLLRSRQDIDGLIVYASSRRRRGSSARRRCAAT